MTSLIKRVAGTLLILEGVWMLYSYQAQVSTPCSINVCPGPQFTSFFPNLLLGLAIALLIVGAFALWGASVAFPAGGVLSVALVLAMGYAAWTDTMFYYLAGLTLQGVIGAVLGAIGAVANIMAMRARDKISEQANPMNLPVFG